MRCHCPLAHVLTEFPICVWLFSGSSFASNSNSSFSSRNSKRKNNVLRRRNDAPVAREKWMHLGSRRPRAFKCRDVILPSANASIGAAEKGLLSSSKNSRNYGSQARLSLPKEPLALRFAQTPLSPPRDSSPSFVRSWRMVASRRNVFFLSTASFRRRCASCTQKRTAPPGGDTGVSAARPVGPNKKRLSRSLTQEEMTLLANCPISDANQTELQACAEKTHCFSSLGHRSRRHPLAPCRACLRGVPSHADCRLTPFRQTASPLQEFRDTSRR